MFIFCACKLNQIIQPWVVFAAHLIDLAIGIGENIVSVDSALKVNVQKFSTLCQYNEIINRLY